MAERRPSSGAGGGEISAAQYVPYPPQQDFETSMMILQQQQQQQRLRQQPQLQQRATVVGRQQQEKQQIRPGPYQQQQYQQYLHHMAYEDSVYLQGRRPTGAGTPQKQNMQESPGTEIRLRKNAASRSVGINPYSNVEVPRSVLDRYPTAFPSLHELSEMTKRWAAERDHKERLRKNSALRYPECVGINPNFSNVDARSFLDLRHLAWSPLDNLSQMAARADELHELRERRSVHRQRSG